MKKKLSLLKWTFAIIIFMLVVETLFLAYTLKNRRYEDFNSSIEYNKLGIVSQNVKAVFYGNSVTALWAAEDPAFFIENNYISRAIGGQTSTHLLIRFRKDVLNLNPDFIVINVGLNDVAEATGEYSHNMTMSNIISMVELAQVNQIRVILTSVTPSGNFDWKPQVKNVSKKIDMLNAEIKKYADDNNIIYVDYNSVLRNKDGSFNEKYTFDGVHPNSAGFEIMKSILNTFISKI